MKTGTMTIIIMAVASNNSCRWEYAIGPLGSRTGVVTAAQLPRSSARHVATATFCNRWAKPCPKISLAIRLAWRQGGVPRPHHVCWFHAIALKLKSLSLKRRSIYQAVRPRARSLREKTRSAWPMQPRSGDSASVLGRARVGAKEPQQSINVTPSDLIA